MSVQLRSNRPGPRSACSPRSRTRIAHHRAPPQDHNAKTVARLVRIRAPSARSSERARHSSLRTSRPSRPSPPMDLQGGSLGADPRVLAISDDLRGGAVAGPPAHGLPHHGVHLPIGARRPRHAPGVGSQAAMALGRGGSARRNAERRAQRQQRSRDGEQRRLHRGPGVEASRPSASRGGGGARTLKSELGKGAAGNARTMQPPRPEKAGQPPLACNAKTGPRDGAAPGCSLCNASECIFAACLAQVAPWHGIGQNTGRMRWVGADARHAFFTETQPRQNANCGHLNMFLKTRLPIAACARAHTHNNASSKDNGHRCLVTHRPHGDHGVFYFLKVPNPEILGVLEHGVFPSVALLATRLAPASLCGCALAKQLALLYSRWWPRLMRRDRACALDQRPHRKPTRRQNGPRSFAAAL